MNKTYQQAPKRYYQQVTRALEALLKARLQEMEKKVLNNKQTVNICLINQARQVECTLTVLCILPTTEIL